MGHLFARITFLSFGAIFMAPASAAVIYNNMTPNTLMAIASRPGSPGVFEIEAAESRRAKLADGKRNAGTLFRGI